MYNKIKLFEKKYHRLGRDLELGYLIKKKSHIFFYIQYKTIYRTYFCFQFLGLIISFKVVDNIDKIEYFYDYIHKTNKRFNL